jgi:uncharacterized membrane protein YhiD involved in acid resistance
MEEMMQILNEASLIKGDFSTVSLVLSLLLAFVLGQVIAWVYYLTHSGLSYSRSFVQSLILITIVITLVTCTIANSFVQAVGLMGALSIIRFRNMIKDTRDIAFIFCSLVIGMATGSQRYEIAIIGTLFMCVVIFYLHVTSFGMHQPHNGFLRFSLTSHIGQDHPVMSTLRRFCGNYTLISAQDSGFGSPVVEYAYQIMIRNASKNETMLDELGKVDGIENVSLIMQEQLLEV